MLGRNKTSTGATAVGEASTTPSAVSTPKGRDRGSSTKPVSAASASARAQSATNASAPESKTHPARPGAKNRPTPKRKDQEAARRRPLVETDRKAAKEADKQRAREARIEQRAALDRGDESALPARDRGPEKRFIRDRVDSRLSLGEIAMPLIFVLILVWFIPLPGRAVIATVTLALVWLLVIGGIIDAVLMWRRTKRAMLTKFGTVPRGSAQYAVVRSMQMRRLRIPKPQVTRGTKVD